MWEFFHFHLFILQVCFKFQQFYISHSIIDLVKASHRVKDVLITFKNTTPVSLLYTIFIRTYMVIKDMPLYWCAVEQKALKECDRESMINTDIVCIKVLDLITRPLTLKKK